MYKSAALFWGKHLKIIKGVALPVLPAAPSSPPRGNTVFLACAERLSVLWGRLQFRAPLREKNL